MMRVIFSCYLLSYSDALQVKVLHIDNEEDWSESDVLIMGTDGLWDVTSNDKVAEIVTKSFRQFLPMKTVSVTGNDIKQGNKLFMDGLHCVTYEKFH